MGFSDMPNRMGRLTNDFHRQEDAARLAFFHRQLDHSSKIIREREDLEHEYGSGDEDDIPIQERVDTIIKNVYDRFGDTNSSRAYSNSNDKWNLIVAGEQTMRKSYAPAPEKEIVMTDLKNVKTGNEVDKEAWILVARGDTKELPDDHLVDLEGKKWYPLAQGGDMYHDSRSTNFKKLSCWGVQNEEEERPWDLENMPIQTGEFIHFGSQPGMFRTIRRQPENAWKKIKAGKTDFVAYCVSTVPEDLKNAMAYFKDIMEQGLEEE